MASETAPLLHGPSQASFPGTSTHQTPRDKIFKTCIHLGMGIFIAVVVSVLVRQPMTVFTYHPVFMLLFLASITEGIALLQPAKTPIEKERGLRSHAVVQAIGYTAAIVGFTAIVYNKLLANKQHFTSAHGKLGLFVFIFMFIQSLFGLTMAFTPKLVYGNITNAKRLWKFHRISGYLLFMLVWLTAQIGVRADYMLGNLASHSLVWLYWLAALLISGGIIGRVRLSKWRGVVPVAQ